MVASMSAFQSWLLERATGGSADTLPRNLQAAFKADDPVRLPVFVAHDWRQHLKAEAASSQLLVAQAVQDRLEADFHSGLGLNASGDTALALELGRALDRSLKACQVFLHLTARPMPDGRSWFRLEIRDSAAAPFGSGSEASGWQESVKVIGLDCVEQAHAITEAIHTVLEARGFQASTEQGLFHLEGPQLVALVAILNRLATATPEALALAG
jgi:hypothetical protein